MTHPIPLEVTLQHLAIVGRTGAGKTYTAKGLVEQLLDAGRRVVILDPTGAWWGLRSRADGSPGYALPVIGGEHANAPLAVESAEALAAWLTEKPRSAVIDLSELLIGDRHRFVERFTDALYRANRVPLHLVIDEADEFAPQNPLPETRRMLHHVDRIVRRGRIRGFRVMMITQRPAVLHKNVLTQVNTLVALRLTAPQDRKAIEAWVEGNGDAKASRAVLDSLAGLKRGEGWVWAPELGVLERAHFPPIRTFDSSRSPEDGDLPPAPAEASIDAKEIRDLDNMLSCYQDHEPSKRSDRADQEVAQLRALVAELQGNLARAATAIEESRRAIYAEGFSEGVALARRSVATAFDAIAIAERADDSVPLPPDDPAPVVTAHAPAAPARPETRVASSAGASSAIGQSGKRRMLVALAQHPAGLTPTKLSILTGIARSGGTWRTYLGDLRGRGLVDGHGDLLRITGAGRKELGRYEPLPTGSALIEYWRARLGDSGKRKIFDVLVTAYPRALSVDEVARRTGIAREGGTWRTYVGELRGLELVHGRGELQASPALFEKA